MKNITIAIAGNPNSGKSAIFNGMTGYHQRVSNYPGVTVEKREGGFTYKDYRIHVVDLPGIYSMTAHSADELVARNYMLDRKADVVVNVVDCSNLERNLYLTMQFMELGVPLILAFNMHDLAEKQGLFIDKDKLSLLFGVPSVFTVATKKYGIDKLIEKIIETVENRKCDAGLKITYGDEIEEEISTIESVAEEDECIASRYPLRWFAIKLLEEDDEILGYVRSTRCAFRILEQLEKSLRHLREVFNDSAEIVIAERRYGIISGACTEAVARTYELRHNVSDIIDKVLLNKVIGLPVFLGFMWAVFKFTFTFSEPLMQVIEKMQNALSQAAGNLFADGSMLKSLVVDGVIAGVGSVITFVPVIFTLFFAIAFMEDSGYMARAAFLMDRFMHKIGLHGRSFIPMLLGFGCNVPAIMAARSIEDKNDRLVTILINPFMSCGARLPVYVLFIGTFFPRDIAGNVLFSIYLLGVAVAVIMARILRKSVLKGEAAPFVMELPPYRMPALKGLLIHMWNMGSAYLKKAGTVIFLACVVVWFLSNFPWNVRYTRDYDALMKKAEGNTEAFQYYESRKSAEKLRQSYAARIGESIAPVFRPLGFGDWKISTGLIGGIAAKEIIVGTLGTLYAESGADEKSDALRNKLRRTMRSDGKVLFTPLTAYSLLAFVLLYVPCIATIAVIRKETNSWRWPVFTVFYTFAVAWIVSFLIYNGGMLIGLR